MGKYKGIQQTLVFTNPGVGGARNFIPHIEDFQENFDRRANNLCLIKLGTH